MDEFEYNILTKAVKDLWEVSGKRQKALRRKSIYNIEKAEK